MIRSHLCVSAPEATVAAAAAERPAMSARTVRTCLALGLASLLALGACSETEKEAAELTVGLTYVPDVQFFPFYVAEDRGYFDEEGLNVTLRHHGAQEGLFTALSSGDEDVVFAGAAELVVAADEGLEAQSFATMYQSYPLAVIVPEASDISQPADLAGRSLGIPGEFGENYIALLAMQADTEIPDLDVKSIGYTQMAALTRGDVDAVIGYVNNDAVSMSTQGFDVRTIPLADDLPLVSVGLEARPDTIDERGEELAGLLRALDKAVAFAEDNREETLEIAGRYVPALEDLEAAGGTLDATLELYRGGDYLGAQDEERWAAMTAFLHDAGLTEKEIDPTSVMVSTIRP
ncbi:MAG: ABC transporter substrate-binding protein [Flaviflexus sp.]|nr:ABC transporter substrate-binding protein [Flaviflexus sp.]